MRFAAATGERDVTTPAGWSLTAAQGLADLLTTPRPVATGPRKGAQRFGKLTPSCADGEARASAAHSTPGDRCDSGNRLASSGGSHTVRWCYSRVLARCP